MTKDISDKDKKKAVTIIVSDRNEKDLCDVLRAGYADGRWFDVISYREYDAEDESDIYVMVGDAVGTDENMQKPKGIIIDLSDSKIMDMIDSDADLPEVRKQLIDGIMLIKDPLIGIDFMDLKQVLQNRDHISAGIMNIKSTADKHEFIETLITKAKVNISECKSAYLYVDGDIGLMEVDELAKTLESLMTDGSDMVFTASYDSSKPEEYYVMILFAF